MPEAKETNLPAPAFLAGRPLVRAPLGPVMPPRRIRLRPGGSSALDFAGSFVHLELFGGVRFLGTSIYCDNSGSGTPAVKSYLSSTQWSDHHFEGKAGTAVASQHGDHFVFSRNYVNTSYVSWAILADSALSGTAGSLTSFATKGVGARPGGHHRRSIAPVSASKFLSRWHYQPFYVAATPSLFGVTAATVADVCGKRFITSIKVEFNMGPRRATACLLNRVTETTDKQAVALRDAMLGQ